MSFDTVYFVGIVVSCDTVYFVGMVLFLVIRCTLLE